MDGKRIDEADTMYMMYTVYESDEDDKIMYLDDMKNKNKKARKEKLFYGAKIRGNLTVNKLNKIIN